MSAKIQMQLIVNVVFYIVLIRIGTEVLAGTNAGVLSPEEHVADELGKQFEGKPKHQSERELMKQPTKQPGKQPDAQSEKQPRNQSEDDQKQQSTKQLGEKREEKEDNQSEDEQMQQSQGQQEEKREVQPEKQLEQQSEETPRQQSKKQQEALEQVLNMSYTTAKVIDNMDLIVSGPPCLLDIQGELPKKNESQPLYLRPGTNEFWLPNEQGKLEVMRGQQIELYCQFGFKNYSKGPLMPINTTTLRPSCLRGKFFGLHTGSRVELRHLVCLKPTRYVVEQTKETCAQQMSALVYRIGFRLHDDRFVQTMAICYYDDKLRTHYTKHYLHPVSVHFQRSLNRPSFSKAGFFVRFDMQKFYTLTNQRAAMVRLMGAENVLIALNHFQGPGQFLGRGHLAARTDFIYSTAQRSTFNYFNVAPQWQSINGGQWAIMEDQVRRYAASTNSTFECYTGTWGTLEIRMPGPKNEKKAYYLSRDINNNGIMPVPKLFYRILLELPATEKRRGIVLLMINDPGVHVKHISNYIVCEDISKHIPWLKWMKNRSIKRGFMFACAVADFASITDHLPPEMDEITELLM